MTKIDVLAVMDELIGVPVIECQDDQLFVDHAKEARAAVASLTEWAGVAEKFLSSLRTGDDLEVEAWTIAESLRAALARIGGAA